MALKGEVLMKAKQRNFVPATLGFATVIFLVVTTVVYDIIYNLPSSEYDTGEVYHWDRVIKQFSLATLHSCLFNILFISSLHQIDRCKTCFEFYILLSLFHILFILDLQTELPLSVQWKILYRVSQKKVRLLEGFLPLW